MSSLLGRLGAVTGAALIMAVVFASFVASDVPLVKMLGLGLAAAVVVDALLMRTLLLPAVMTLAGRWNWYPGSMRSGRGSSPAVSRCAVRSGCAPRSRLLRASSRGPDRADRRSPGSAS